MLGVTDWLPLVPLVPDQAPEALHDVVLVELQVRFEFPPMVTVLGEELRLTVGKEGGDGGEVAVLEIVVTDVAIA